MSYEHYEPAFETHECFWYLKLGSSQNVSMLIVLHAKERPPYILTKAGERLSLIFMLD